MLIARAMVPFTIVAACVIPVTAEAGRTRQDPWMRVSATAYCAKGTTGSGAQTRKRSVAADPRLIPLGSTIRVRGLRGARDGTFTVLDSGRGIKGREIDVFIPRCGEAKQFGRQHVHVQVIKRAAAAISKR